MVIALGDPVVSTAWDITVTGEHNYFVAGSETSSPVLVHNADNPACGELSPARLIKWGQLTTDDLAALNPVLNELATELTSTSPATRQRLLNAFADFATNNPALARSIDTRWYVEAANASNTSQANFRKLLDVTTTTPALRQISPDAIGQITRNTTQLNELVELSPRLDPLTPKVNNLRDVDVTQELVKAWENDPIRLLRALDVEPGGTGKPVLAASPFRVNRLDKGPYDSQKIIEPDPGKLIQDYTGPGASYQVSRDGRDYVAVYDSEGWLDATAAANRVLGEADDTIILAIDIRLKPQDLFGKNDLADFQAANRVVKDDEVALPDIQVQVRGEPEGVTISMTEYFQNPNGSKPPLGWTWHHHQETGRMQLVRTDWHGATNHTGGSTIWGASAGERLLALLNTNGQ